MARERNDIGAVINLDGDLLSEYQGYVDGRYVLNDTVYPVPILTIGTDTMERLYAAVDNADAVIPVRHVTATAPHAYAIHLPGTSHMSVTDLPLISPLAVQLITAAVPKQGGSTVDAYATIVQMNQLIRQFFDVYLKGQGSFSAAETR